MQKVVEVAEFLKLSKEMTIIDVRSPIEFKKGYIPKAQNVYLFSDEDRHKIGIIYKQQGKDKAILAGLDLVGPKMKKMVNKIDSLCQDKKVLLHCWRGGMRSNSVAWLLNLCGFEIYLLSGGYKAFRKYILQSFETSRKIRILGGKTGSAKTHILKELKNLDQSVIDLEALAFHKGSAFGGYDQPDDLTNEQFENELGLQLLNIASDKTLWLEDESRTIGRISLPNDLWLQMRSSDVTFLEVSVNQRIENILNDYADYPKEKLIASINKISKKLGGVETNNCVEFVENNQLDKACEILLRYYDKSYLYSLNKREHQNINYIDVESDIYSQIAHQILNTVK